MIRHLRVKPKCKLPQVLIVSHLIGKTVAALREANMNKEASNFIEEIKMLSAPPDYGTILKCASKYVIFYE